MPIQPPPAPTIIQIVGRPGTGSLPSTIAPPDHPHTVAIENMTKERYIIGFAVENKLCWTGAWLRNRGFDVLCPGGHVDCTANIPYLQPHSERRMGYKIAEDFSLEDFWIRTVTTDGDSKN